MGGSEAIIILFVAMLATAVTGKYGAISPADRRLVSLNAVADMLGISRSGAHLLIQSGALESVRIGRRLFVTVESLDASPTTATSRRLWKPTANDSRDAARPERAGHRIAAYSVAAKGATLLNRIGICAETLDFVVDRNVQNQGRLCPVSVFRSTHPRGCSTRC